MASPKAINSVNEFKKNIVTQKYHIIICTCLLFFAYVTYIFVQVPKTGADAFSECLVREMHIADYNPKDKESVERAIARIINDACYEDYEWFSTVFLIRNDSDEELRKIIRNSNNAARIFSIYFYEP